MRRIPACTDEFGLKLFYHVPQVHTLCLTEPCIVEIEEGEEALYPRAAELVTVPRDKADSDRYARPPDLGVEPTRFVPEPRRRCIHPDIVVCPRKRTYGADKNWGGWWELASRLRLSGFKLFAAGAPDSSAAVPCDRAWGYRRFLDASIEAMRNARLVIATDSGLAHLAVLCGAPLLLVTYRGLVAPGPVRSSRGRLVRGEYWPAGEPPNGGACRFEAANHTGAPITKIDGWTDVAAVAEKAKELAHDLRPRNVLA